MGAFYTPSFSRSSRQDCLQNREPPYLEPGSEFVLEKDMVLCIEVGAFDEDIIDCVLWLEDIVIVTDDGCEVLTADLSRDLLVAGTI